jgi:hypothetical protein
MNRIRNVRRLACILTGLAIAALASAAPALAMIAPMPGGGHATAQQHLVPLHTVAPGGMPGWQIGLIAAGAALAAVILAALALAGRRRSAASAT